MACSPWGCKESGTSEQLNIFNAKVKQSRKGNVVHQFLVTQICTSYVKTLLRFFLLDSRLFSPENTTSTLSTENTINLTPSG